MSYAYNSKIYLAEAALNVKDLARQTAFYTHILGLELVVSVGGGGLPWGWRQVLGAPHPNGPHGSS